MYIFNKIKFFIVERLFRKLTRKIRYNKRLKEMKKQDPYIYK